MGKVQRRLALTLILISAFFWGLVAIGSHLIIVNQYEPKLNEIFEKATEHQATFIEDLEYLESNRVFPISKREKNLHAYVKEYIRYTGKKDLSEKKLSDEFYALLEAFENKSSKKYLRLLRDNKRIYNLDVSFIDGIFDYDHWNFLVEPMVREKIKEASYKNNIEKIGIWATLPVPNYEELRFAVIVRFMQLTKNKDFSKANDLHRHFVYLLMNSQTLIGAMVASAHMSIHNSLVEVFSLDQKYEIPGEYKKRYKRSTWAWAGFFVAYWFKPMPEKMSRFIKPGTNACAGLIEGPSGAFAYSDFFGGNFPFEYSFNDIYSLEKKRRTEWFKYCGLEVFESWLSKTPPGGNPWFTTDYSVIAVGDDPSEALPSFNKSKLPYLRPIIGWILITIAVPNFTRLYDEEN